MEKPTLVIPFWDKSGSLTSEEMKKVLKDIEDLAELTKIKSDKQERLRR